MISKMIRLISLLHNSAVTAGLNLVKNLPMPTEQFLHSVEAEPFEKEITLKVKHFVKILERPSFDILLHCQMALLYYITVNKWLQKL